MLKVYLNYWTNIPTNLKKGGFGIKKRVEASAVKNLPKLINTNEVPEGLDIKKILLNVFTKRSYDALGEFSKDAMLISCMHFMDPFNFDEDRVKNVLFIMQLQTVELSRSVL